MNKAEVELTIIQTFSIWPYCLFFIIIPKARNIMKAGGCFLFENQKKKRKSMRVPPSPQSNSILHSSALSLHIANRDNQSPRCVPLNAECYSADKSIFFPNYKTMDFTSNSELDANTIKSQLNSLDILR